jgi:hypothetical protein
MHNIHTTHTTLYPYQYIRMSSPFITSEFLTHYLSKELNIEKNAERICAIHESRRVDKGIRVRNIVCQFMKSVTSVL